MVRVVSRWSGSMTARVGGRLSFQRQTSVLH